MKEKLAVGAFSRNNYDLFGEFFVPVCLDKFGDRWVKLTVDDFSDEKDVAQGQALCTEKGITFLENETRGLQFSIQKVNDWLEKHFPDCKWLVIFQTDCFLFQGCHEILGDQLLSGKYDQFGTVGFNIAAEDLGFNAGDAQLDYTKGNNKMMVVGRSPLAKDPPAHWYRPSCVNMTEWDVSKPFAVEIPNWMAVGLNLEQYRKNSITPTDKYHMIHAWDDICMQFLQLNVMNVCMPFICGGHIPQMKSSFGMIHHSPTALKMARAGNKDAERIIGNADHSTVWTDRWGWSYDKKDDYDKVKDRYAGTLMETFRNHDLTKGPLEVY